MSDRICLRLGRRDMNTFRTVEREGKLPVVHVAGRFECALCPVCARPSATTNGTGWREVIDVVRTLVIALSICVRRFVCEYEDCPQRSFDERFEGIGRGGASERALAWFADLARGRATRAVARDVGVPEHYLRLAVGAARRRASARRAGHLGRGWPSTSAPSSAATSMPPSFLIPSGEWSSTWPPAETGPPSGHSPGFTNATSAPGSPW